MECGIRACGIDDITELQHLLVRIIAPQFTEVTEVDLAEGAGGFVDERCAEGDRPAPGGGNQPQRTIGNAG